jgi:hypothetical protein
MVTPETILMEQAGNGLYPTAVYVNVKETMQNKCKTKPVQYNFNFNLFCVHLIHRGYGPSDIEIVSTEIRLQVSYAM